jgi:hypothetical protein
MNLWENAMLERCVSMFAASCGTLKFVEQQHQSSTNTMMDALIWQTLKNLQPALDIWITSIMSFVNGLTKTLSTSKDLTKQLICQTTLPKFSIFVLITSWAGSLHNTLTGIKNSSVRPTHLQSEPLFLYHLIRAL